MSLSRRRLVQGTLIAAAGLGGYFSLKGDIHAALLAHLAKVFGPEIGRHPDTAVFVDDFILTLKQHSDKRLKEVSTYFRFKPQFLPPLIEQEQTILDDAVHKFLQSTNVVKSFAENVEFKYIALFDPYYTSCGNQMSANWS
jgi:hypothetical protein